MARTVTVTRKSVIRNAPKRYIITLNLQYKEDDTVLINKDYSQEYLYGENPSAYVARWLAAMQSDIDDYKAAEAIYANAQLITAASTVQSGLVV